MKTCTKCKIEREITFFRTATKYKDGLFSRCDLCRKQYNSDRYKANKEAFKARNNKYRRANQAKYNFIEGKRRASTLQRTPNWLTKADYAKIEEFYVQSRELTETTGIKYEVDHIIPLQGKNVSGLHVPENLQIITKSENCIKSNSYE